jgi:UDP-N-acetylmuramoyl-L-alanyl-D-glutamate--2,6-diaminopimelate ligase
MSAGLRWLMEAVMEAPDVALRDITADSREVQPGDLFVAIRGGVHDGHDHVPDAVRRGAAAVLAERPVEPSGVPVLVVPGLRDRLGELAARFYGMPGRGMRCVGVTGTNGKTSIAHYVADLAGRLGRPAGYLGTIGWGRIGALEPSALTTVDPITLQRRLAALREGGCRWAALEVSSHALAQRRVCGVPFRTAVFSNLTRDHLDYHADFAAYGAAKARLFRWPGLELAVINADDSFGRQLCRELAPGTRLLRYGKACDTVAGGSAEIVWSELAFDAAGVRGIWETPWGRARFRMPLHAEFSVANAAAALGALCADGVSLDAFVAAAEALAPVPGRMEYYTAPGRPAVVVDYAHTPDALEQVLTTLRPRVTGRLVCVFGCGGDRDPGKRPLMAMAAERHADELWLTSDNPRSEPAEAIIAGMRPGLSGRVPAYEHPDRRDAIERAIAGAGPDDLVLVAGKGHEDYQEIGGRRLPFSDRDLVRTLLGGGA